MTLLNCISFSLVNSPFTRLPSACHMQSPVHFFCFCDFLLTLWITQGPRTTLVSCFLFRLRGKAFITKDAGTTRLSKGNILDAYYVLQKYIHGRLALLCNRLVSPARTFFLALNETF